MKIVYTLKANLEENPRTVVLAQKLTLDSERPQMGLSGVHGLFASSEWWENVRQGKMPTRRVSGTIIDAYVAGQDSEPFNNTIDLRGDDGVRHTVGIYVNKPSDAELFVIGKRVEVIYVLDILKLQPSPDGGINYLEIALEMAVSL